MNKEFWHKKNTAIGAVDLSRCPNKYLHMTIGCYCGNCIECGFPKHSAIHGPFYGQLPGSKPYGHQFQPDLESVHG